MLVVLTTLPSKKEAQKMATSLLKKGLIVCAQRNKIKSTYVWQGQICKEKEYLLRLKVLKANFKALEKALAKIHPYEIPQIIALEASFVNKAYLEWAQNGINKPR